MFFVGVDLGQARDHSAIAVVEKAGKQRLVRSIVRVPLGTPYPAVIERVRRTVQHPRLWGNCCVAVDATGVGAPVVESMRSAELGCTIWAVTITGGEQARSGQGLRWSVPKRDPVAGVQVLLERGDLRIAKALPDALSLLQELRDMQVQVTRTGRTRTGAEAAGEHDDLVIALALACWRAGRGEIGPKPFPLGWV